jgi:hypothetical protein
MITLFKRKPKVKSNIIKVCPRWAAGYPCHMVNGIPCNDCGRGIEPEKQ